MAEERDRRAAEDKKKPPTRGGLHADAAGAAEAVAGELSTGTFTVLPQETPQLRARHAARILALRPLDDGRASLELAVPVDNIGDSLPVLMATLLGNVFELRSVESLRLVDFRLPLELASAFPGPAFGVAGTRTVAGVARRPLIGTIVKPSVGLSPGQTAVACAGLAEAGIDFVKDDELIADPPYSPLSRRIRAVRSALRPVEERQGRAIAYAPNVTGDLDHMLSAQALALREGAGALMVCVHAVGLAGILALRRRAELPLHGHRAGWGLLGRGGEASLGPAAHARLWRLAGVDQLHVGGLASKFFEPDESVVSSIRTCLQPDGLLAPVMPVLSSGQWGGQLPGTVAAAEGPDFLYLAGGAIAGHRNGAAGGVRALRAAAEAAIAGEDLAHAAGRDADLAASLAQFSPTGGRR